jgi:hypothetical protein
VISDYANTVKTNATQSWPLIAEQLGFDLTVPPSLNVDSSKSLASQLAQTYHQLLHPFEMVWEKAVSKQQSQMSEKERELEMMRGAGIASGADLSRRNATASINQQQQIQLQTMAANNSKNTASHPSFNGGSGGGKANASPTLEELGEARHVVDNLRRLVDAQRRTSSTSLTRRELSDTNHLG